MASIPMESNFNSIVCGGSGSGSGSSSGSSVDENGNVLDVAVAVAVDGRVVDFNVGGDGDDGTMAARNRNRYSTTDTGTTRTGSCSLSRYDKQQYKQQYKQQCKYKCWPSSLVLVVSLFLILLNNNSIGGFGQQQQQQGYYTSQQQHQQQQQKGMQQQHHQQQQQQQQGMQNEQPTMMELMIAQQEQELQQAIQDDPTNSDLRDQYMKVLQQRTQLKKEQQQQQQQQQQQPDQQQQMMMQQQMEMIAQKEQEMEQAYLEDPHNAELRDQYMKVRQQKQQMEQQQQQPQQQQPDQQQSQQQMMIAQKEKELQQAITDDPTNSKLRNEYMNFMQQKKQMEQQMQQQQQQPQNEQQMRQMIAQKEQELQQAITEDPTNSELRNEYMNFMQQKRQMEQQMQQQQHQQQPQNEQQMRQLIAQKEQEFQQAMTNDPTNAKLRENYQNFSQQKKQIEQQMEQMQQQPPQNQQMIAQQEKELQQAIVEDPTNSELRFRYGWFLLTEGAGGQGMGSAIAEKGIAMLQTCHFGTPQDSNNGGATTNTVLPALQGYLASSLIGRFLHEQNQYEKSHHYLTIAYEISKTKMSPKGDVSELCVALQLATQFDSFPTSVAHTKRVVERMEHYQEELLLLMNDTLSTYNKDVYLNEGWLSQQVPGAANDPYVHCLYSLFTLSFYYDANTTKVASQHYQLSAWTWPTLTYVAQHVQDYEDERDYAMMRVEQKKEPKQQPQVLEQEEVEPQPQQIYQTCIYEDENEGDDDDRRRRTRRNSHSNKIQLGVVSATLDRGHSVSEDFGGILQRLDRNIFNVTYLYIHEKGQIADDAPFLTANNNHTHMVDGLYHYARDSSLENELQNGAWLRERIGIEEIEHKFQFDMILYLEMTMSSYIRRLGMMRLAPVQLNTHGHPVTSGHPSSIIQYFVSWAEAELPSVHSSTYYTEDLQLIPHGKLHQYYTPRVLRKEVTVPTASSQGGTTQTVTKTILKSRMDGQRFDHLTRQDFHELPFFLRNSDDEDDDIHLYVCMQKPFKLSPEFDELLCRILKGDPQGHAILHKDEAHHATFLTRLESAGCGEYDEANNYGIDTIMKRVHFIHQQPSHKLLKLYSTANVVLDSYPAGGCTTTREVFECGTAVVTWPARLLGGRWTLGLYNILGVTEATKQAVIASSKEDYIAKAIAMGTNHTLRQQVEADILQQTQQQLFYRHEAVTEWEKILLKVSPVKQCSPLPPQRPHQKEEKNDGSIAREEETVEVTVIPTNDDYDGTYKDEL